MSQGITFAVRGPVGQPDAGASSGATYTVRGGFWSGATAEYDVYLPLVLKDR